jgi:hypothetical protein
MDINIKEKIQNNSNINSLLFYKIGPGPWEKMTKIQLKLEEIIIFRIIFYIILQIE